MVEQDYLVVRNDVGQYSIWPADKPVPSGWHIERQRDSRDACLQYVSEVWTDMTPATSA